MITKDDFNITNYIKSQLEGNKSDSYNMKENV